MSRDDLQQTYHHFQPVIDSLIKTGMEFHYFNEGFQKKDLTEMLKSEPDTTMPGNRSYWSLAADLDQSVAHAMPLYLFTNNLLRHFTGARPAVSRNLNWETYTPADALRQEGSGQEKRDSTVLRITIFSGTNTDDSRYLKAAIDAIREFSKMNIRLSVTSESNAIKEKQDWLFRLSDEPLPNEENNKNVLVYEKGRIMNNTSWIRIADDIAFSPVGLYKTIFAGNVENDSMTTIWQDGFGHPVLSLEKRKKTAYFHFYSRFNPDWNGLVWSNSFPEWLLALLKREEIKTAFRKSQDNRIIDSRQLLPVFTNDNGIVAPPVAARITDLSGFSWILVFLVFFIERLVSFHYYKRNRND